MTTNENPAAVRVCAISDIQCSRGCGTGPCKREQATENSRADALTDEQRDRLARLSHPKFTRPLDAHDKATLRQILAAFPVEQPAAAPIATHIVETEWPVKQAGIPHPSDKPTIVTCACGYSLESSCNVLDPTCSRNTAPSPADERAAISELLGHISDVLPDSEFDKIDTAKWNAVSAIVGAARSASANETGAEGTDAFAHEVWSAAQRAPGEGIEDAVQRIAAILSRSPAMAAEAVAIPVGWKLVRVNEHFDALIEALERADSKGYLPAAMREEWENFACDENVTQPAQVDARVGLTAEQREAIEYAVTWLDENVSNRYAYTAAKELRALLATRPGQPEPRAEVTNPFRELLAALIDIYDDERNNAPENRCYVEGAWSEVLGEARALLAPLPDPAQVAAESPDWVKNALPPEGA